MRSKTTPTQTDRLAALLRVAVRKADDPALRAWLKQLLRHGEAAGSTAARPAAAERGGRG